MGTHHVADLGLDFSGRKAAARLTTKLNSCAETEYRDLVAFTLNNPTSSKVSTLEETLDYLFKKLQELTENDPWVIETVPNIHFMTTALNSQIDLLAFFNSTVSLRIHDDGRVELEPEFDPTSTIKKYLRDRKSRVKENFSLFDNENIQKAIIAWCGLDVDSNGPVFVALINSREVEFTKVLTWFAQDRSFSDELIPLLANSKFRWQDENSDLWKQIALRVYNNGKANLDVLTKIPAHYLPDEAIDNLAITKTRIIDNWLIKTGNLSMEQLLRMENRYPSSRNILARIAFKTNSHVERMRALTKLDFKQYYADDDSPTFIGYIVEKDDLSSDEIFLLKECIEACIITNNGDQIRLNVALSRLQDKIDELTPPDPTQEIVANSAGIDGDALGLPAISFDKFKD